jgi:hypothetical protein
MICLDVKNVYTSTPKHETKNILKYKLIHSNKFNSNEIQKIKKTIKIIKNLYEKSLIYILRFKCNCNTFYLGKTNRNFKINYEDYIS